MTRRIQSHIRAVKEPFYLPQRGERRGVKPKRKSPWAFGVAMKDFGNGVGREKNTLAYKHKNSSALNFI
jgi:hypothetical protein